MTDDEAFDEAALDGFEHRGVVIGGAHELEGASAPDVVTEHHALA